MAFLRRNTIQMLALLVAMLSPMAFSQVALPPKCPQVLGDKSPETERPRLVSKIKMEKARVIVGDAVQFEAREMLNRAIKYIEKQKYNSLEEVMADFDILLWALSVNMSHIDKLWNFDRWPGHDGSIVYRGYQGHALVLQPSGDIFKGVVDKSNRGPDGKSLLINYARLVLVGKAHIKSSP